MKTIKKIAALVLVLTFISACAASASANSFSDVPAGSYYAEAAQYCLENGLISGTGDGKFSPNMKLSRGMLATILWRNEGQPDAAASTFSDVKPNAYYAKAVSWAAEHKIVSGYGNGRFGPEDNVERQQAAAMIYRYAQYKSFDMTVSGVHVFADDNAIASYAKTPVAWAYDRGLISGKSGNRFDPSGKTTRAEAGAMVYRYITKVEKAEEEETEEEETEEETETPSDSASGSTSTPTPAPTASPAPTQSPTPTPKPEETTVNQLNVSFNGHTYTATLVKNATVDAFVQHLKDNGGSVTISAHDYGGWEKVGGLGKDLGTAQDVQTSATAGDFVLYTGDQIVLFYGNNSWSYTRLGRLDGDLSNLKAHLGSGDVDITYSLPN